MAQMVQLSGQGTSKPPEGIVDLVMEQVWDHERIAWKSDDTPGSLRTP